MAKKLLADFFCVPNGEIYPRTIPGGEDCPPELEGHALALGLIAVREPTKAERKAAEDAAAKEQAAAEEAAKAEAAAAEAAAAEAAKAAQQ